MNAQTNNEEKVIYIHILDANGLRDFDSTMTAEDAADDADEMLFDANSASDTDAATRFFAGGWEDIIVRVHSTMADFDKATGAMVSLSYFADLLGSGDDDDPRVCYYDDGRDL